MGPIVNLENLANAMNLAYTASMEPEMCPRARQVLQTIAVELFIAAGRRSPREIALDGEDDSALGLPRRRSPLSRMRTTQATQLVGFVSQRRPIQQSRFVT